MPLTNSGKLLAGSVSSSDDEECGQVYAQVVARWLLKALSVTLDGFLKGFPIGIIGLHEAILVDSTLQAIEIGRRLLAILNHLYGLQSDLSELFVGDRPSHLLLPTTVYHQGISLEVRNTVEQHQSSKRSQCLGNHY